MAAYGTTLAQNFRIQSLIILKVPDCEKLI